MAEPASDVAATKPVSILKKKASPYSDFETSGSAAKGVLWASSTSSSECQRISNGVVWEVPSPSSERHPSYQRRRRIRKLSEYEKEILYRDRPDLRPGEQSSLEQNIFFSDLNHAHINGPFEGLLGNLSLLSPGCDEHRGDRFFEADSDNISINSGDSCSGCSVVSVKNVDDSTLTVATEKTTNITRTYVKKLTECAEVDLIRSSLEWTQNDKCRGMSLEQYKYLGESTERGETIQNRIPEGQSTAHGFAAADTSEDVSQLQSVSMLQGVLAVKDMVKGMLNQGTNAISTRISSRGGPEYVCGDVGAVLTSASSSSSDEESVKSSTGISTQGASTMSGATQHDTDAAENNAGDFFPNFNAVEDMFKTDETGRPHKDDDCGTKDIREKTFSASNDRVLSSPSRTRQRRGRVHKRGPSLTEIIKATLGVENENNMKNSISALSMASDLTRSRQDGDDKIIAYSRTSPNSKNLRTRSHRRAPSLTDIIKATLGMEDALSGTDTNPKNVLKDELLTLGIKSESKLAISTSKPERPQAHRRVPSLTDIIRSTIGLDTGVVLTTGMPTGEEVEKDPSPDEPQSETTQNVLEEKHSMEPSDVVHSLPGPKDSSQPKSHGRRIQSITDIVKAKIRFENGISSARDEKQDDHGCDAVVAGSYAEDHQNIQDENRSKESNQMGRTVRRLSSLKSMVKSTIGKEKASDKRKDAKNILREQHETKDTGRNTKSDGGKRGVMEKKAAATNNERINSELGENATEGADYSMSDKENALGVALPGFVSKSKDQGGVAMKGNASFIEESTAMDVLVETRMALFNATEDNERSNQLMAILDSFAASTTPKNGGPKKKDLEERTF